MGLLALILSIVGGLCTVMGVITALTIIPEVAALTWMFWMVLAAILFLASITVNLGRSEYE